MTSLGVLDERIHETQSELQKCIEIGRILRGKDNKERLQQFQRITADVKMMKEEATREIESYKEVNSSQTANEETLSIVQQDIEEITNARKALEIFLTWIKSHR